MKSPFPAVALFAPLVLTSFAAGADPFHRVGSEFVVNSFTEGDQDFPAVSVRDDGSFVVAWESRPYGGVAQDGSGAGVFAQLLDPSGVPVGGELAVNLTTLLDQADPDVAFLEGGGFVVVWDDESAADGSYRGIFARLFDAAGSPTSGELPINQVTAGHQNDAVVAPQAGGGFVVVWETQELGSSAEDLAMRRFDALGAPIGDEMDVHVFTSGDQEDADVATTADGGFVVVWESDGQDGHYESVVLRRFEADGTPSDDEEVVNTDILGDQANPFLGTSPHGGFAVVWEDDETEARTAAFGRFYDGTGAPLGDGQAVDAGSANVLFPHVAFGPSGDAFVVWTRLDAEPSDPDVLGRRWTASGDPLGDEIVVNAYTTSAQVNPLLAIASSGRGAVIWETVGQDGDEFGVAAVGLDLPFFEDGFESGNVSAWTESVP